VGWRARSPQALERRVGAIEASGLGRGWIDGDLGHGRAYRFDTPEGHPMELFWEVDYGAGPAGRETVLLNRPERRPRAGVPVRRIDHLNLMTADAGACRDFMVDVLGFRERERVVGGDDGPVLASWLSVTNLSHDIALVPEPTDQRGRLHHVCFHYISVQHLFDVAELAKEAGIAIEHGPGRHGIGGRRSSTCRSRVAIASSSWAIRLPDLRSGMEDRGLEGVGARRRGRLDRLAVAGLVLGLRHAASGAAGRPASGRRLRRSGGQPLPLARPRHGRLGGISWKRGMRGR
jgi:catechol 2,3-dioxygenase-like lactoylglutathione lyase family enzyme